jgi:hypothetical protein
MIMLLEQEMCFILESFDMCIYRKKCDLKVSFPDFMFYLTDYVHTVMHPVGC